MSPTIPAEFFQELGRDIQERLGSVVDIWFESCRSGPSLTELATGLDPFSAGKADLAHLCAPTYIRAHHRGVAELLGFTPIFLDERNNGKAVYFSDVMVPRNSSVRRFEDLRGGTWAYNDLESLSGFFSMLYFLHQKGESADYFAQAICSGGHRDSLKLLERGEVDCAAIDGDLMLFLSEERKPIQARKLAQIGPFPAPPLAISSSLDSRQKSALRAAFEELRQDRSAMQTFKERFKLQDFVPVDDEHYRPVVEILDELGLSS